MLCLCVCVCVCVRVLAYQLERRCCVLVHSFDKHDLSSNLKLACVSALIRSLPASWAESVNKLISVWAGPASEGSESSSKSLIKQLQFQTADTMNQTKRGVQGERERERERKGVKEVQRVRERGERRRDRQGGNYFLLRRPAEERSKYQMKW